MKVASIASITAGSVTVRTADNGSLPELVFTPAATRRIERMIESPRLSRLAASSSLTQFGGHLSGARYVGPVASTWRTG